MSNAAIAEIFEEIARLMELEGGENPFRIRAYRRAADSLRESGEDVSGLAAKGELQTIPGIGPDLSAKITEYLAAGRIKFHEDLKKRTPAFLLRMLTIPGVGPATARALWQAYKPRDFDRLAALARAGKLRRVAGIGEKSERNILEGITAARRFAERMHLGRALPFARAIAAELEKVRGAAEVSLAGSVRRRCETIGDIDLLVSTRTPAAVAAGFLKIARLRKIIARGPTKISAVFDPGIQVDLRIVPPESFGAALLYFTGSRGHNIKLRGLARKKGFKVNEYGLFSLRSGRRAAGATEEEMYGRLGLAFIPPELREDRGEIEAAARGALPRLVTEKDVRGDFHVHSRWSDGADEIAEMARSAKKRGLSYIALTDHSRSLKIANGLEPARLARQIREVRRLNERLDITVLTGSEVDILSDGTLDFSDVVLRDLDFVVASVHTGFKQGEAQITRRIVRAMRHPCVNLIGHPTGRLFGEREGYAVDLGAVFAAAKETNTALEINSFPNRLDLDGPSAYRARESGAMLAVNTDSHAKNQFENLEYGIATARRAWCEKRHILNCLELGELKKRIRKAR